LKHCIFKRILGLVLAACIAWGGAACALTGSEALGLTSTGELSKDLAHKYVALRQGSRDQDESPAYVVVLQARLAELGYLSGTVDGQYGQKTTDAVLRFQQANALSPTGIADPATQAVLHSKGAIPAPPAEPLQTDTAIVQRKLIEWGFLTGEADGSNGAATQKAVAMFKHYVHVLNEIGYRKYFKASEPTPEPAAQPAQGEAEEFPLIEAYGYNGEITEEILRFARGEYEFKIYEVKVQAGDRGDDVLRVQNRLSQLKYLYRADGSFGDLTRYALMYFQYKNGLPESGIADRATQELLFSDKALVSDQYVSPYKLYVDLSDQYVYVFGWYGHEYGKQLKRFKCSTGVDESPTPVGTYQASGKTGTDGWYYFEQYDSYAMYPYRIAGGLMFHSVLFNAEKEGPSRSSVRKLGEKATKGGVRLSVEDAQWIYENCPRGTTVVVQK